jgi:hypothetical protein
VKSLAERLAKFKEAKREAARWEAFASHPDVSVRVVGGESVSFRIARMIRGARAYGKDQSVMWWKFAASELGI